MKASVNQQLSLAEVTELDAELGRIEHRLKNLAEQSRLEVAQEGQRQANDRLATLQIAVDDFDERVGKLESEIDSVRERTNRDRRLLDAGTVDAKQLSDLQHELETLRRRQSNLEDTLLEVMERREELQRDQNQEVAAIDELDGALADAQRACSDAREELARSRQRSLSRREELASAIDADLLALYERQRARGGAGAGLLQGGRCGACRIEIDRGGMAKISAAADDDVLRCPECGAILLRVKASRA